MSQVVAEKKVKKTSSKVKKLEDSEAPVKIENASATSTEGQPKKVKKEKKIAPPKTDEPAPPQPEQAPASDEAPQEGDEKLSRKKRSYAQLVAEVDLLNSLVEQYIVDHKEAKNADLNRFLKVLEKGLRKVRVHVQKMGKNRSTTNASSNGVQSGFQKPVRISEAVAQFTGWSAAEPRARVEVTNFVCDYIKKHDLQSPDDRRVILADQKLSHLLDYNSERDGNLTYATIQKLLAKHYTPLPSA